jgi:hypothetical protein
MGLIYFVQSVEKQQAANNKAASMQLHSNNTACTIDLPRPYNHKILPDGASPQDSQCNLQIFVT